VFSLAGSVAIFLDEFTRDLPVGYGSRRLTHAICRDRRASAFKFSVVRHVLVAYQTRLSRGE
jgi:hypothetical protein